MQVSQDLLKFAEVARSCRERPWRSHDSCCWTDWSAGRKSSVVDQGFHVAEFGNQFEDILLGQFAEFWTQEYVMANVVDPGNKVLKNDERSVAQQVELASAIAKVNALKKGKRHAAPNSFGGLWILS